MASPFQRYQGGIEASTGNLVQASGQMAAMTANTIAGFGQNLAEGLKTYNENSQKSEAANAKIQMLGQAYADKIAMYSKDPEIAQSGILDSLMAKAKMLQDAPTKGLSQRVMIAHEAETSLAGFGGQLQEWSFLRGREMERNAEEALRKFAGFKSVTQPAFVGDAEFQVDLNLTPQEAQAQALAKLGRIRKSNPNLQGTDEEFLSAWRTAREQALAGAKDVNPSVVSAGLEALAAEKRNAKAQADAQKKNDISGLLSSKFFSTEAPAVGGALNLPKFAQAAGEQPQFLAPVGQTVASMKDYEKTVVSPVDQVNRKNAPQQPQSVSNQGFINGLLERKRILQSRLESDDRIEPSVLPQLAGKASVGVLNIIENQNAMESLARSRKMFSGEKITPDVAKEIVRNATGANGWLKAGMGLPLLGANIKAMTDAIVNLGGGENLTIEDKKNIANALRDETARSEIGSEYRGTGINKTERDEIKDIDAQIERLQRKPVVKKPANAVAPITNVPAIPLQGFQIGTEEKQKRITVAERQREVADFVTSRMGAIDPTDPERKRRLPVAGFDKFYKSLVPEAEIREFTTDSGVRMMYANGKWEQIKGADPMTMQDIRKQGIGIYGQQNAQGGFTPTEFVENSGVYIGGIFKGTDSANDKYSDEMTQLIDARRSVKELQRINDLVGESLMPVEQGRALVEQMNLSAMLRTDIVGVGTVSNYEQQLIAKVIKDPTAFFSFESKDRAILVALSQRVDRRIKAISASKGLTVQIRDDSGSSKYQALREQYLREKGIL